MEDKDARVATLKKEIKILEDKIDDLEKNASNWASERKISALYDRLFELKSRILIEQGPTYTDGVLDLYLEDGSKVGLYENYKISLSGTEKFIGSIRVCYEDMKDNVLGNIGYGLYRGFRGNGYMLQALEILREPMLDKGLSKPIINVEPDNIPSVRTIEKFGGKKLDKDEWYDSYEVDLEEEIYRHK